LDYDRNHQFFILSDFLYLTVENVFLMGSVYKVQVSLKRPKDTRLTVNCQVSNNLRRLMEDYSTWIVKTRTRRGWNTNELAEHSGIPSNSLWQYETHKRTRPDPEALAKIANALDYPAEVLWQLAGIAVERWTKEDEHTGHIVHMIKRLSPEDRKTAIDFLEYLVAKQDR
jgi:transcriptional regulator with XRE-family HTH domain